MRLEASLWHRQQRLIYFTGSEKEESDGPIKPQLTHSPTASLSAETMLDVRFPSLQPRFPNRCQEWQKMQPETECCIRSNGEPKQSHSSANTCTRPGVATYSCAIFSKLLVVRVSVCFGKQKQNTSLIILKGNTDLLTTWKAPSLAHSKNLIYMSYYGTRLSIQP